MSVHVLSNDDVEALIGEFRNEVLDETLRSRVRDETREVRNLILALAFSNTGLVTPKTPSVEIRTARPVRPGDR